MSKSKHGDKLLNNSIATVIMAFLCMAMGVFFIMMQRANEPVPREEAAVYSGEFESYKASRNYCSIHFTDGSSYEVYPHTETKEFREKMESLESGTVLWLLVNPNNNYVAEIKTENEELLNFELSQEEIDSYDNAYIVLGIIVCVCGVFLIIYQISASIYKYKENARHKEKIKRNVNGSAVIRYADNAIKSRILLDARVQGYDICYRRVKSVNELVINGRVYDEKKGIIEYEHRLTAVIDGHTVEVGYDEDSCSYIMFDGEIIKSKKRFM